MYLNATAHRLLELQALYVEELNWKAHQSRMAPIYGCKLYRRITSRLPNCNHCTQDKRQTLQHFYTS